MLPYFRITSARKNGVVLIFVQRGPLGLEYGKTLPDWVEVAEDQQVYGIFLAGVINGLPVCETFGEQEFEFTYEFIVVGCRYSISSAVCDHHLMRAVQSAGTVGEGEWIVLRDDIVWDVVAQKIIRQPRGIAAPAFVRADAQGPDHTQEEGVDGGGQHADDEQCQRKIFSFRRIRFR